MTPFQYELEKLLDMICREWGFCLPRDKRQAIAMRARLDAREFAAAVLSAEGFSQPEYEVIWVRRLSGRFKQHFGMATVSADQISN